MRCNKVQPDVASQEKLRTTNSAAQEGEQIFLCPLSLFCHLVGG